MNNRRLQNRAHGGCQVSTCVGICHRKHIYLVDVTLVIEYFIGASQKAVKKLPAVYFCYFSRMQNSGFDENRCKFTQSFKR